MDLLNPIYTEKAECQDCYKCLRECSVKAIKVEGGRAAVVPELCVLCGHCVEVCPVGAKKVRNDLARAKLLLESRERVVASVAPSFAAEFGAAGGARLVAALRRLGFHAVSETARGADLVARRAAEELARAAEGRGRVLISSACPTVVEHVKKYRPRFAEGVTSLFSPLLAHARELKALYGEDAGVVFIGPCISKKRESDLHRGLVDVAIDFADLAVWFEERGIRPAALPTGAEDRFVPSRAGKGALYPVDGGMIAAIKRYAPPESARFMAFSGLEEIDRALADLSEEELDSPVFLELLACPGGCVNGPRAGSRSGTVAKRLKVLAYADGAPDRYDGAAPDIFDLRPLAPVREAVPGAQEIAEALRKTGKYSREDELNCGACGYDACRDFARAMLAGKAEQGMCVSYMRKLAQKKANGLIAAIPSGVVIVDSNLAVVECNRAFAKLAGEEAELLWDAKPGLEGVDLRQLVDFHKYFRDVLNGAEAIDRDIRVGGRILHAAVFGIERGSVAGGVFQDITAPWVRKDRVVSQAKKVINKNLAVVQKIAFLLGENAAESEAILTSIIDSFEDGERKRG